MEEQEIVEYANRLLKKYTIDTFSNEVNIFDLLNKISKGIDIEKFNENMLKNIEDYLDTRVRIQNSKNDYNFLSELADNLELQKIRKSDQNEFKVIFFKVKDINNNEYIFLTRKYLNEYVQLHKDIFNNPTIMELDFQGNPELNKLLEIIKRNFRNNIDSNDIDNLLIESKRRQKKYHNIPVVDVMNELSSDAIMIIEKLGIELENTIYTEYEFDTLEMQISDYYTYDGMSEEDMTYIKSLDGTGVTNEDVRKVLHEIYKISKEHNF